MPPNKRLEGAEVCLIDNGWEELERFARLMCGGAGERGGGGNNFLMAASAACEL